MLNCLFLVLVLLNCCLSRCARLHNHYSHRLHHGDNLDEDTYNRDPPELSFGVGFRDAKLNLEPSLQIPRGVKLEEDFKHAKAINPSVLRHEGKTWVAYRGHLLKETTWLSSVVFGTYENLGLFRKSHDLLQRLPMVVSRCLLKQPGHFISGPADPRLFHDVDGTLMVSYLHYSSEQVWTDDSPCSDLTSYRASVWVKPVHLEVPPTEIQISEPNFSEKNWLFFRSQGRLYTVYSLEPHVVLHVDINTGRAAEAFRTSSGQLARLILPQTNLHLGAGPVHLPYMNAFLFVGHTTQLETRQYVNFLYLTEDSPPFGIRCVQRQPLPLFSDPASKEKISFASGISVEGNALLIWYGADDKESRVFSTRLDTVLSDMHCGDYKGLRDRKFRQIVFQPRMQSGGGFQAPSLVKLPKGSLYPYVVVARAPYSEHELRVRDRDFKLLVSTLSGCVLDKFLNCVRDPVPLKIKLPWNGKVARTPSDNQRCARTESDGSIKMVIGPDNPRLLVRGDDVLLFFEMSSTRMDRCSGVWMTNLRAVMPIDWVLPSQTSAFIPHSVPTEFVWNEAELFDRAWSPIFHEDVLLLALSANPQRLLSTTSFDIEGSSRQPTSYLEEYGSSSTSSDVSFHLDVNYHVEHSTQWLKFRLCNEQSCSGKDGSAYISVLNVQTRGRNVDSSLNFACVRSAEPPFSIEKIVPVDHVMFEGRFALRKVDISSIAFRDDTNAHVGFVDSRLILGFTVGDQESFARLTSISELMGTDADR